MIVRHLPFEISISHYNAGDPACKLSAIARFASAPVERRHRHDPLAQLVVQPRKIHEHTFVKIPLLRRLRLHMHGDHAVFVLELRFDEQVDV